MILGLLSNPHRGVFSFTAAEEALTPKIEQKALLVSAVRRWKNYMNVIIYISSLISLTLHSCYEGNISSSNRVCLSSLHLTCEVWQKKLLFKGSWPSLQKSITNLYPNTFQIAPHRYNLYPVHRYSVSNMTGYGMEDRGQYFRQRQGLFFPLPRSILFWSSRNFLPNG